MRYSASEKVEIIHLVEQSSLSVRQTLQRLDIHRSTFYNWLKRYDEGGVDACKIISLSQRQSGINYQKSIVKPLLPWPWTSPHCRLGNWLSGIPMNSVTLSRNPPSTVC